MIQLRIGDLVEIDGKEFEIWSFKCLTSSRSMTGQMELVDPIQATRWREKQDAEERRVEMLSNGSLTRVIQKTEQALD